MTQKNEKINNQRIPSTDTSGWWLYAAQPNLKEFNSNGNSGKWCIFRTADTVDDAWQKIKEACEKSDLIVSKVSTALGAWKHDGNHVICVYNYSWEDENEIAQIRKTLHDIGFTEPLKYKRDIDTINRVYGDKEWYIDEEKSLKPLDLPKKRNKNIKS